MEIALIIVAILTLKGVIADPTAVCILAILTSNIEIILRILKYIADKLE